MKPRLLLVEEAGDRRHGRREALEASGYRVLVASDAVDALRQASALAPGVVVLHLDLPFFDGIELMRRLRALDGLSTLLVVALGSAEARTRALDAGCEGFVADDVPNDALVREVDEYVAGRREPSAKALVPRAERLAREVSRLEGANERLRDDARTRGEFLQSLSHELATPLTPLVGYLRLLRNGKLGALSERQQQVVEAMSHASERLGRSIDNLVDYAALETGQYRIHRSSFDASVMVDACVAELHPKARGRHVHVETRRPDRLLVTADERKLRQALANVLDNAIRYSPHGGDVLVDVRETEDWISFEVYDQGQGLSDDTIAALTAGERLPDERGGSGLGMPVSRQIAVAHGGELRIESPPTEQPETSHLYSGARVVLRIPREPAA